MKKSKQKITIGGYRPNPKLTRPQTIILTQTKRFGIDIGTYINALQAAENIDYSRRTRLYDLYADILMDAHLTAVINKRKSAVLSTPIEFSTDGVKDPKIGELIESPWFSRFLSDALDSIYWGFSLVQFYKEGDWINYDLVPRKHVDPIRQMILRRQTDITGSDWDDFDDLLFIGDRMSLGLLAQAAPYVIYKRNTFSDWAQFSEVFGMPIREYTYDATDPDARNQIMQDLYNEGSLAVLVHPEGSNLKLLESGNKSGSAEVYDRLAMRCNNEISKLILGNTLTTEAGDKGTQALGSVQKKSEDQIIESDRKLLLNILNYDLTDTFARFGYNTQSGRFGYSKPKESNISSRVDIAIKLDSLGIPIDFDQLYEETGFRKPKTKLKKSPETPFRNNPEPSHPRKNLLNKVKGFF